MEKVIHKLINEFTEGVDTYTYNGSTWLIFTESKEWVIELTESKTLWYNYNFFKSVFSYTSMDVVDNQHYITKWVEDNFINEVKDTILEINITEGEVDDIIQDGVKETSSNVMMFQSMKVEDTIKNGVKETIELMNELPNKVKKIIKKGVKLTQFNDNENKSWIEGVIKKGVRHTFNTEYMPTSMVEKTINNGVKETNPVDVMKFFDNKMEDALQNGVKETNYDTDNYTDDVNEVIREGVRTSHQRQYVGGDIVDKVIDKGVKEIHDDVYHHKGRIDGVINNGVRETKTPGKDGDIMSTIEWMNENNTSNVPKMIDDVIDNGEKINGTYAGGQRQSEKCKSVVEYGKQI